MANNLERQVMENTWNIKGLHESIQRTDANVENVRLDVKDMKEERRLEALALAKFVTTVEGAANAAKEAADKTVTAKQYYLGVFVAVLALAGLIVGVAHV